MTPSVAGPATYLVPAFAVAMIVLRNLRMRRLRIELMWIAPALILLGAAAALHAQPPRGIMLAIDAAVLAVGAVAGWWRGRFTRITIDPATHALTSKTSPIGMLLILGIFAERYALRSYGAQTASLLHVSAVQITDALLLLAVGLVCAQRLEIALRATRLLKAARAR